MASPTTRSLRRRTRQLLQRIEQLEQRVADLEARLAAEDRRRKLRDRFPKTAPLAEVEPPATAPPPAAPPPAPVPAGYTGARVVARHMLEAGRTREEVAAHLEATFDLDDAAGVVAEMAEYDSRLSQPERRGT